MTPINRVVPVGPVTGDTGGGIVAVAAEMEINVKDPAYGKDLGNWRHAKAT